MFDWLGQRTAVKGLETFDSARGLKHPGMVHDTIPGGYLETTPSASMMCVMHAAHGTRQRQTRNLWTQQDNECSVPSLARHNGSAEPGQTCCMSLRSSAGGCRYREVDYVAAKRLVKYLNGTRDTEEELRPRKGTLHLYSASDSVWAGCPTTRKSSSGAMVWLNGALVSSLCRTQGLIAFVVTRSRTNITHAQRESPPVPSVRRDRTFR